ncbi:Oidioi.mRNA.OKI2018_I69.PAR.g9460.t1.cds [Oikopleura dioica]|uniref:Oidioi.mRNA.OKI2018_I69.PAR.g9460.t1.cds n=1 Tax=Oikopleura dioica TaxID=34765 RepID=A0ABN7RPB4_OIKDI|nr:Oidioi.mRNA.OKI2018_I69.PAR.g9460.t1.cds [Oikopleura dioica]
MEGKSYLFKYRHEEQYAYIHRFDNETIKLDRKLWVKQPFDVEHGLFVTGAGLMDKEMTFFACGVQHEPDICYFADKRQFHRIPQRKPMKTFTHFGTSVLRNAIKGITTLDGHFGVFNFVSDHLRVDFYEKKRIGDSPWKSSYYSLPNDIPFSKEYYQAFVEVIENNQGFLLITVGINFLNVKRFINIHRLYNGHWIKLDEIMYEYSEKEISSINKYLMEPLVNFHGFQMDGNLLLEHVEAVIDDGQIYTSYAVRSQFIYVDLSNMKLTPVELVARNTTMFEIYTTQLWN